MKSGIFRILTSVLFLASCGCSKPKDVHIDINLDKNNRPLEVDSYYLNDQGEKIRHGECFKYEWDADVVVCEKYQYGERVSGVFVATDREPIGKAQKKIGKGSR